MRLKKTNYSTGWVDYIGSSHQWWHVIIFLAFYHWQQTGQYYAQFRARHGCFELVTNGTTWALDQ